MVPFDLEAGPERHADPLQERGPVGPECRLRELGDVTCQRHCLDEFRSSRYDAIRQAEAPGGF